jgi:hypothetical protein
VGSRGFFHPFDYLPRAGVPRNNTIGGEDFPLGYTLSFFFLVFVSKDMLM